MSEDKIETLDAGPIERNYIVRDTIIFRVFPQLPSGFVNLTIRSSDFMVGSIVAISVAEADGQNRPFMGLAGLVVYNVVPRAGECVVKIHNTWRDPLKVAVSGAIWNSWF